MGSSFEDCAITAKGKTKHAELSQLMATAKSLLVSWRGAYTELNRTLTARKTALEQSEKEAQAASKAAKKRKVTRSIGGAFMESMQKHGSLIPTYRMDQAATEWGHIKAEEVS